MKKLSCTNSTVMPTTIIKSEINYDEVKSWSQSFDRLMQNSVGRALFKEYLTAEHAEENILFWESVESYHQLQTVDEMEEVMEDIYNQFISDKAKWEVSLDSKCRMNLEKNITNATRSSFDEAQLQVYKTMERDNYTRFQRSKMYLDFLMKQISHETRTKWSTDFDELMTNDEGRHLFLEFLELEKADENIRFYEATQDYRKILNSRHRKTRAREIFNQFVSTDARTEISIDGPTRQLIKDNYEKGDAKLFEGAEKHIYMLMKGDSYPRFIKSNFFKNFLDADSVSNNETKPDENEPVVDDII